jgi:serine/threonine protein kinase
MLSVIAAGKLARSWMSAKGSARVSSRVDWARAPACSSRLARRLLNLKDGISPRVKRIVKEMRPTTATVSISDNPGFCELFWRNLMSYPWFSPRLTGLLWLPLFVLVQGAQAQAPDQSQDLRTKSIIFRTDPPGATVFRNRSGVVDELGRADQERPLLVEASINEREKGLQFYFQLPQFGGTWQSPNQQLEWQELKGEVYPSVGAINLNLTAWQKIQAELLLRPLPTILKLSLLPLLALFSVGLFLTRARWLPRWRETVAQVPQEQGTTYGDYTILGELGRGAMGVVHIAQDADGLKLALKSVLPEYAQDEEFAKRFEHEIRACLSLKHPNLLRYYGHGVDSKGIPFSATELLEGSTLKEKIRSGIRNPARMASDVVEQIGSALHYIHGAGLVHRDIKPDNIFVCQDGTLKLMDLGLVTGEAMTLLTKTGQFLGTPAYMAPEQFDGQTSAASDQYSLGIILYELLVGRRPFMQTDIFALAFQHKDTPPGSITGQEPRVTLEIEEAVLKMLAKKPYQRFESLEQVRETLSDKLLYLKWDETRVEAPPEEIARLPESSQVSQNPTLDSPAELETTDSEEDPWLGQKVGKYQVERPLGAGGMALVYLAREEGATESVALKVVRDGIAKESDFQDRFLREIEVSATVNHPNVVRLLDSGVHQGSPYLVQEFVDGESFSSLYRPGGRDLSEMLPYVNGLIEGLLCIHSQGIIHRDLKPDNIMVTRQGQVKIMDLGLARSKDVAQLTKTGQSVGTPAYFPPEQITGADPTPASDQYSLGILLYELFTGVRPFNEKLPMKLLFQHISEQPADPRDHNPNLHPTLSAIILRMLAKTPEARFSDLTSVKQGLECVATGRPWELPPLSGNASPADGGPNLQSLSTPVSPVPEEDSDGTVSFHLKAKEAPPLTEDQPDLNSLQ